ncbi:Kv channel-interacting protein 4 [Dufourea novaeangliae]|uniref:Kv channel-interacting protein 4 n=1 Tax=Dufourea novaeangliae TaxID=178035 RepID=A0A154PAL0_DUFNO|nr:Kv channel-interacting protein 4 [Dufourea novaeangliae]
MAKCARSLTKPKGNSGRKARRNETETVEKRHELVKTREDVEEVSKDLMKVKEVIKRYTWKLQGKDGSWFTERLSEKLQCRSAGGWKETHSGNETVTKSHNIRRLRSTILYATILTEKNLPNVLARSVGFVVEHILQCMRHIHKVNFGQQLNSPMQGKKMLKPGEECLRSGATWGRASRGHGRDRGGGANLLGSGVAPANYASGLGVAPELREVVNILGERNQVGTLTGVGPPPGALDDVDQGDEEEGTSTKRPPRPLYRRLINYVRQAWTGVKFALDSEYEEEQTPRYRPDSLASLCRATRFTEAELKRIYRGFKAECPTGVVREETFKCIYSQFFPQGANTSQYAHYVFNTLDQDHSGILSFEDFVTGLSILSRGSIDEKLRWTFSLYDINGDGCITREEMTDIVTAVYELMGKFSDPNLDHQGVRDKVDRMFQKMDGNKDGVVTLSEFLEACRADPDISTSMAALDTAF